MIKYFFSRKKLLKSNLPTNRNNKMGLDKIKKYRKYVFEQKYSKFRLPLMYYHKDDLRIQFFYGKDNFISAVTNHTQQSSEFTNQILERTKPSLTMLGGLSNTQMNEYINEEHKVINKSSDLFCKEKFQKFYLSLPKSNRYYFNQQIKIFYETNNLYKITDTNDYITAGLVSLYLQNSKLIYGKPDSILILEDLIMNYSLEDLKHYFYKTVSTLKERYYDEILHQPFYIQNWLMQFAMQNEKDTLFAKQIQYTTSLFKKAAKTHSKCILFVSHYFIDQVCKRIERTQIDPDQLFRGFIDNPQHPDYQKYIKMLKQETADTILQKVAILGFIVSRELKNLILMKKNIFNQTIFKDLFKDLTPQQIFYKYLQAVNQYRNALYDIQTHFIANNLKIPLLQKPKFLSLSQQLQLNKKRLSQFPIQYQIDSIPQKKKLIKYLKELKIQMIRRLKRQKRFRELNLLKQHQSKQFTRENIIFFTKYFGEMNIKLGLKYKLPIFHFGAFRGYFKGILNDEKLSRKYKLTRKDFYAIPKQQPKQQQQQQINWLKNWKVIILMLGIFFRNLKKRVIVFWIYLMGLIKRILAMFVNLQRRVKRKNDYLLV